MAILRLHRQGQAPAKKKERGGEILRVKKGGTDRYNKTAGSSEEGRFRRPQWPIIKKDSTGETVTNDY